MVVWALVGTPFIGALQMTLEYWEDFSAMSSHNWMRWASACLILSDSLMWLWAGDAFPFDGRQSFWCSTRLWLSGNADADAKSESMGSSSRSSNTLSHFFKTSSLWSIWDWPEWNTPTVACSLFSSGSIVAKSALSMSSFTWSASWRSQWYWKTWWIISSLTGLSTPWCNSASANELFFLYNQSKFQPDLNGKLPQGNKCQMSWWSQWGCCQGGWISIYMDYLSAIDEEAQPPYLENWFYLISNSWNALQDEY